MNSKRSNFNGRRFIVFLMVALILVMGFTLAVAGALDETFDPALAWEDEAASTFQLARCGYSVSQNDDEKEPSFSNQDIWDPALAWEGGECLARR